MYIFNSPLSKLSAAELLTAVAVTSAQTIMQQSIVKKIGFVLTTAVVSTGSVVVEFYKRPTAGSTGSQVLLGTLTIPAGTAAGKTLYKNITPVSVAIGGDISCSIATAAAGGGAAGAGVSMVILEEDPESDVNNSNMIASA